MPRHRIPTIRDTEPTLLNNNLPIKRIVVSFLIAVAAITGLILYYSLARAVITLEVKPDNTVMEALLPAGQDGIKATIKKLELSEEKTFPASPSDELEEKASGLVTIVNNSNADQTLIATTRLLSSDNILFRIQETVTVPRNGQIEIKAIADEAGPAFEIPAGRFTIPGLRQSLREQIYAQSTSPMKRMAKPGNKVTSLDFEKAKQELSNRLVPQALSKLREQLPNEAKTYAIVYQNETTDEKSNVAAGTAASEFKYQITEKVTAVFYDLNDLRAKLLDYMQSHQENGKKILSLEEESLTINLDKINDDLSAADLKIKFLAQVTVTEPDKAFNKYDLIGRTPEEVKNYFDTIPGVIKAETTLSPFWVKSVPTVPEHIQLLVK
ncbi:MAG: hypothetical protein ACOZAJ_04585 [Patescibacteria group bacterium]